MYAAAAAAAATAQLARTRRSEPSRSASRPIKGPAARRITKAAARIKPICCGVRPLLSNSFGQYGDATPKAPYNVTYSRTYANGAGNKHSMLVLALNEMCRFAVAAGWRALRLCVCRHCMSHEREHKVLRFISTECLCVTLVLPLDCLAVPCWERAWPQRLPHRLPVSRKLNRREPPRRRMRR